MGYYNKTYSILKSKQNIYSEEELIENLKIMKNYVGKLRESFKKFPCYVDYSSGKIRAAYLMAYYPFYILPIVKVLEELEFKSLSNELKVSAFGCGPAPEVVGIYKYLKSIKEDYKSVKFNLLDFEKGWKNSREYLIKGFVDETFNYSTNHKNCNLLDKCEDCESNRKCKNDLKESNIIVIQNCLNDISADIKLEKIEYILKNYLNKDGVLIIIDLSFKEIEKLLKNIEVRLSKNILMSTKLFEIKREFSIPQDLENHIFTGEENFIPKKYTKYYRLVFKK